VGGAAGNNLIVDCDFSCGGNGTAHNDRGAQTHTNAKTTSAMKIEGRSKPVTFPQGARQRDRFR